MDSELPRPKGIWYVCIDATSGHARVTFGVIMKELFIEYNVPVPSLWSSLMSYILVMPRWPAPFHFHSTHRR